MKTMDQILNPKKDRFFYRDGEKISLNPIPDKVLVKFNDNTSLEQKQSAFSSLKEKVGLMLPHEVNNSFVNGTFHLMDVDLTHPGFRTTEGIKESNIDLTDSSINFLENVFENIEKGTYIALTDQLFIKLKSETELNVLQFYWSGFVIPSFELRISNPTILSIKHQSNPAAPHN